jgi:glycosyltransferase involved in cell wall biosynthesis
MSNKKIILYAGSLTKWGGVNSLIEAFKLIERENIELWICGPGKNRTVEHESKTNTNIKFLGFLDKCKLNKIYETASIFVNPRPSHIIGNEYNFPSKLFEYLSYLKPIVSTKTPGIPPEYEKILIMCEDESATAISEKIIEALDWNKTKIQSHQKTTVEFLSKKKTWESQTDRLSSWLNNEFSLNLYA